MIKNPKMFFNNLDAKHFNSKTNKPTAAKKDGEDTLYLAIKNGDETEAENIDLKKTRMK